MLTYKEWQPPIKSVSILCEPSTMEAHSLLFANFLTYVVFPNGCKKSNINPVDKKDKQ